MKKVVLMLAMVAVCFSASAALVDQFWDSQFIIIQTQTDASGGLGPDIAYEDASGWGAGWYAEVFNITDNGGLGFSAPSDVTSLYSTEMFLAAGGPGISPILGEYGGYMQDIGTFGAATDLDNVQMVLYNNADKNLATWYITSLALALPDAPDTPDPDAVKVTFDFTGQTWQAIPEPATVLLFGIGGMGAWLLRRRQQA